MRALPIDVESTLRRVAALRELCRRLPHLPTPGEAARLRRYQALCASPHETTVRDTEAIVAGWRAQWRAGDLAAVLSVARRLPGHVVAGDRRLQSFLVAAQTAAGGRDQTG